MLCAAEIIFISVIMSAFSPRLSGTYSIYSSSMFAGRNQPIKKKKKAGLLICTQVSHNDKTRQRYGCVCACLCARGKRQKRKKTLMDKRNGTRLMRCRVCKRVTMSVYKRRYTSREKQKVRNNGETKIKKVLEKNSF